MKPDHYRIERKRTCFTCFHREIMYATGRIFCSEYEFYAAPDGVCDHWYPAEEVGE